MERGAQLIFWHCGTPRMWKDQLLKMHQLKDRAAADTHDQEACSPFASHLPWPKWKGKTTSGCQGDLPPALTFSQSSQWSGSPCKSNSCVPHSFHSPCPLAREPSLCSYTCAKWRAVTLVAEGKLLAPRICNKAQFLWSEAASWPGQTGSHVQVLHPWHHKGTQPPKQPLRL